MRRLCVFLTIGLLVLGCQHKSKRPVANQQQTLAPAEEMQVLPAHPVPAVEAQREPGVPGAVAAGPTTRVVGPPAQSIPVVLSPGGVIVRIWPETVNTRPSGDTKAGPIYYYPTAAEHLQRDEVVSAFMEPAQFLLATALAPINMIVTPPWSAVLYSSAGQQGIGAVEDVDGPKHEQPYGQVIQRWPWRADKNR